MSAPEPMPHGLKTVTDCFGIAVRLTEERMAHILEHPEMREMDTKIDRLWLRRRSFAVPVLMMLCDCFMDSTRRPSSVPNGCVWL